MALATNFKSTQDLKVVMSTEATVGSGTKHASGTWYQLALMSPPTINEQQVSLDTSSQQTGSFITAHSQMVQRYDNPMWEIQLQILGNSNFFEHLSGYWTGANSQLTSTYSPADMKDGATNGMSASTEGQLGSSTIVIGGGSFSSTARDIQYKGCILKDWSLSHSIDSNGGSPVINMTWVTGYLESHVDTVSDGTLGGGTNGSGWTDLSSDFPTHWTGLTTLCGKFLGEAYGSSEYDVRAYGYNINISRDIQRVGYQDTTNYKPYAYQQVGGLTVTGDMTIKTDNNKDKINDFSRNQLLSGFSLEGSGYKVWMHGKMADISTDTGSPELRSTYSFQGGGNLQTTKAITIYTDQGGGITVCKSVGHGLSAGQRVTIAGSTNYNGTFYITKPTALSDENYFGIVDSFVANDGVGTWTLHADSLAINRLIRRTKWQSGHK